MPETGLDLEQVAAKEQEKKLSPETEELIRVLNFPTGVTINGVRYEANWVKQTLTRASTGEVIPLKVEGGAPTYTHPTVERMLYARERSGYGGFTETESTAIRTKIEELRKAATAPNGTTTEVNLDDEEKFWLQELVNARISLHSIQVAWNNADSARNKGDMKAFKEQMITYQLSSESFRSAKDGTPTFSYELIKGLPYVGQVIDEIKNRAALPPRKGPHGIMKYLTRAAKGGYYSDEPVNDREIREKLDSGYVNPSYRNLKVEVGINLAKRLLRASGDAEKLGAKKLPTVLLPAQEAKLSAIGAVAKGLGDILGAFMKGV